MEINDEKLYTAKYHDKIYSLYGVSKNGNIYNVKSGRIMKQYPTANGYYQIMLYDNGISIPASVHHLIYESITGINPAPVHKEIDHLDSNKGNNAFSNLDLVTHAENIQRSLKKGTSKAFKNNITPEAATHICELLQNGYSQAEVIRMTGYSPSWVRGIHNGDYCIEISNNYTWNDDPRLGISIPDSVIHGICQDLSEGKGIRETARKWNVGHTTVAHIRDGKTRTDISSKYDMSGLSDAEKLKLQTGEHVVEYVTKKGEPTDILVSNLGRFFRAGALKEQSPSMQHKDPCVVVRINGKPKRPIPCKKIVAEMFCDNPNGYRDIIHIDGNLFNLKSTNLRYISHDAACKANTDYELRRSYDGSLNPNARLSDDDAQAILIMHHEFHMSPKYIAKQFNITPQNVKKICSGEVRSKLYNEYMRGVYRDKNTYYNKGNLAINIKW